MLAAQHLTMVSRSTPNSRSLTTHHIMIPSCPSQNITTQRIPLQLLPAKTCYLIVVNCINCRVLQCTAPPSCSFKSKSQGRTLNKSPTWETSSPTPNSKTHYSPVGQIVKWLRLLPESGTKRGPKEPWGIQGLDLKEEAPTHPYVLGRPGNNNSPPWVPSSLGTLAFLLRLTSIPLHLHQDLTASL